MLHLSCSNKVGMSLDYQFLLKLSPLTLLAGSAPDAPLTHLVVIVLENFTAFSAYRTETNWYFREGRIDCNFKVYYFGGGKM